MARKRMVHPDIWTDSKFLSLKNDEARLLFIGLMNFANDEGIFQNNIITIKAQVLPLSNTKLALIEGYISNMLELKLLEKGQDINGTKLLRYKNWHTYQKINHATPSKYTFTKEKKEDSLNTNVEVKEESSKTPSQYNIIKNNIIKDNIDKSSTKNLEEPKQDFSFEHVWEIYPRKRNKQASLKAYKRLPKKEFDSFVIGLKKNIEYWKKHDVELQFVPYLSSFINGQKYYDELLEPTSEKKNFKSDLDKEIYHRNNNLAAQSQNVREYLNEASKHASDEVPNLLKDFKKNKESNAKPIKDVIGQMVPNIEANTGSNGK
jgi:hypothetical protein